MCKNIASFIETGIKQEQTNQMKKTASVEYDGKGAGTSYKMYDTHRPSCLSEQQTTFILLGASNAARCATAESKWIAGTHRQTQRVLAKHG